MHQITIKKRSKMKVRFNRWYNAVLTALLSMLGFSCSLDEPDEYGSTPVEYGTPHADYILKGTVTDEAGTPIKGIKTSLKEVYKDDTGTYVFGIDSIQTNESGNYQLKNRGMPYDNRKKLVVEDIDGEANGGEFLNDTLDIDYDKAVKVGEGDHHWYVGKYEVATDVRLKKKQ